jgi:hypothetical protein
MILITRLDTLRRQRMARVAHCLRLPAFWVATRILLLVLLITGSFARSQSGPAAEFGPLLGSWEGPLTLGRDEMKLAFTFTETDEQLSAALVSAGLGVYGMPADEVILRGRSLTVRIPRLDLEFTATLRFDESGSTLQSLDGNWFQAAEMVPVILLPVDQPSF